MELTMKLTKASPDYTAWTPEQLMRDYHGELKRELFVRCMEWYTNPEVEAKINACRTDGSKIKNPNFYAEFKRNIDIIALREGKLPTEMRLEFDKRRALNFEARFGAGNRSVESLKASIRHRETIGFPVLSAKPTLQELEAARPDSGKKPQNGRETRDYWHKFLAATKTYTAEEIKIAYDMAPSTTRNEIARAKRIVARIKEIELLESEGQTIQQTYFPPHLLAPGQPIYSNIRASTRPSLVVALRLRPNPETEQRNKIQTKTNDPASSNRLPSTSNSSTTPPPPPTPTILLSYRMKTVIARLQYDFIKYPDLLPPLSTLATRFQLPIEYPHATKQEREAVASCETEETLAEYAAWCDTEGAEIVSHNDVVRVTSCLSHIVRRWYDDVLQAEVEGIEELWETFLQVLMRRLEDLGEVEREIEDEEMVYDGLAREAEMAG